MKDERLHKLIEVSVNNNPTNETHTVRRKYITENFLSKPYQNNDVNNFFIKKSH